MTIVHTEGESNKAPARRDWDARQDHAPSRALLERDADAFLHACSQKHAHPGGRKS